MEDALRSEDADPLNYGLGGLRSYGGSRVRLFHDGALARLADVLDPRRLERDYRGGALGPGPVLSRLYFMFRPKAAPRPAGPLSPAEGGARA